MCTYVFICLRVCIPVSMSAIPCQNLEFSCVFMRISAVGYDSLKTVILLPLSCGRGLKRLCLQIVNSTMLTLNVGEQSSVKKAVSVLATIAPAESFCMHVLRKEPGLICFRPAGEGIHKNANHLAALHHSMTSYALPRPALHEIPIHNRSWRDLCLHQVVAM